MSFNDLVFVIGFGSGVAWIALSFWLTRHVSIKQFYLCATVLFGFESYLFTLVHNHVGEAYNAAAGGWYLYQWWKNGGDDDTKRRLRKLRDKFKPARRTAPQSA